MQILQQELKRIAHDADVIHRTVRDTFVQKRLSKVCGEVKEDGNDPIADMILKANMNQARICESCSAVNQKTRIRNCQFFNDKLPTMASKPSSQPSSGGHQAGAKETDHAVPYAKLFCSRNSEEPPLVVVGDSVDVNPNSYDTLRKVLRSIGKQANVRRYHEGCQENHEHREWLSVVCDGSPYTIISNIRNEDEFNWVVLRPGGGHFEINMIRSYFELNWEVFMKPLASLMCFRTEAALNYAKKAHDHHKLWDLFTIIMNAAADEMIYPYVKECRENNATPTVGNYYNYAPTRICAGVAGRVP
jgi:hypothetical protein